MASQSEINEYWEKEVCGTRVLENKRNKNNNYRKIKNNRYESEPFIKEFACFEQSTGKNVLEIGVGAGTDFIEFLKNNAYCKGLDATEASILETKRNISNALKYKKYHLNYLEKGNAECLPFEDNEFDIVYSYGVLHHAKNTMICLNEAQRVLKPGGVLKLMVYSNFSATGIMLKIINGFLKGKFLLSQEEILFNYLESPGTKSYSKKEIKKILEGFNFKKIKIKKYAGSGDLLLMNKPSSRYNQIFFYKFIRFIYPRKLIKRFESIFGLFLTITAYK